MKLRQQTAALDERLTPLAAQTDGARERELGASNAVAEARGALDAGYQALRAVEALAAEQAASEAERRAQIHGAKAEIERLERELASHATFAKGKLTTLTRREIEVLELLGEAEAASHLAARLFISTRTVESHLANAYRKLGVRTRSEAIELFATMKSLVERFEPDVHAATSDLTT